jgi:hypothetical protein
MLLNFIRRVMGVMGEMSCMVTEQVYYLTMQIPTSVAVSDTYSIRIEYGTGYVELYLKISFSNLLSRWKPNILYTQKLLLLCRIRNLRR